MDELFNDNIKYMVGQLEQGAEGTRHYQFVACFKKSTRIGYIKKWDKNIHVEECKSVDAAIKYCTKLDTRIEGPWTFGDRKKNGRPMTMKIIDELTQEEEEAMGFC